MTLINISPDDRYESLLVIDHIVQLTFHDYPKHSDVRDYDEPHCTITFRCRGEDWKEAHYSKKHLPDGDYYEKGKEIWKKLVAAVKLHKLDIKIINL